MKGTTTTGFEFEINEKDLDDMRILDMIVEMSEGDLAKLSPLVKRILGEEQRERLYAHLEEKEGRASVARVSDEISEIFVMSKAGKNSLSSPE